jgi:glycosyltransferase involved in cell wall biosynthesis
MVWGAVGRWIRGAARIVAVSEFEKSAFGSLLQIPEPRLTVIPSGVDRPSRARLGLPPPGEVTPLIASVGRLEEYKGHDRIIRALPAVAAQVPDVRLIIVGGGPDERRLRRMALELEVADRVEIREIPFQRRDDLHALLAQARLVVALSAYESQGLAATEAAAQGCSVLVADSSALQELVTARLARGVDRDSPGQVVAAVVAQLRNPHRPVGVIPSWEECAERTVDVYTTAQRG